MRKRRIEPKIYVQAKVFKADLCKIVFNTLRRLESWFVFPELNDVLAFLW